MGTYYGSTYSSSIANPPVCISAQLTRLSDTGSTAGILTRGTQLWWYSSTNNTSEVSASGFITDGYYLGMRPGDVLIGSYQSSNGSTTGNSYRLWVSAVTTAAVTFSTAQQSTA